MNDRPGDHLRLAGTAHAFGAARHEPLPRRLQHLGDAAVGRHEVLVTVAVDDDREGVIAMIAGRVDDLRREPLDVRRRPCGGRARLLDR